MNNSGSGESKFPSQLIDEDALNALVSQALIHGLAHGTHQGQFRR